MFLSYKEVNYQYVDKSCIRKLKIRKFCLKNSYNISKINVVLFFWFRQLQEFELVISQIHHHLLLIWLISRQYLYITNYANRLVRGIRYYRFILRTVSEFTNIFLFIDFLVNFFLRAIKAVNFKLLDKHSDNCLFVLSDFNPFSNIRISNVLYLPTLEDRVYLKFFNKSSFITAYKEVNLYKII